MRARVLPLRRAPFLGLAVWIAGFTALYAPVAGGLARDWAADANYSHGFLVVPLAGYLMWARRARIASAPIVPSWWGLGVVAASVVVFLAGTLGAELFLTRISMVGVVAGSVLLVAGWRVLRATAVPVAFLLLMVPPPAIVFNAVAMPLQLWASQAGEALLRLWGVPIFREGNVLVLPNVALQVSEACSGIRSLASLTTAAIVFADVTTRSRGRRVLLAASAVPIAILVNALRVAATGVAAAHFGPAAAHGVLHTISGWLMFVAAVVLLWVLHVAFERLGPDSRRPALAEARA
jgi:exosortase